MAKTCLGNIAKERKENCKNNKEDFRIVGLKHIVPKDINLSSWEENKENTFTKMFHKGDVLFGRRRAYLKKAAIAPFDGICSGDITVIQAIPEKIIPELLPFIIQNDRLFDYAIEKSAGSLSPRVKWEHLKKYEFNLPPLTEQKKLAKVLWAAEKTRQGYKSLLTKTDELIKSKFIEMFGDISLFKKLPVSQIILSPISGEWGKDDLAGDGTPVLRTTNFTDFGEINYSDVVTRKIDNKKIIQKSLKNNDIIIEKSGGSDIKPVGRVVRFIKKNKTYLTNNFTAILRINSNVKILPIYLFVFLFINYINNGTKKYNSKTTGIHNLKLNDYLNETIIPIPDMLKQELFEDFYIKYSNSKSAIQQSLDELNAMTSALINENLK